MYMCILSVVTVLFKFCLFSSLIHSFCKDFKEITEHVTESEHVIEIGKRVTESD